MHRRVAYHCHDLPDRRTLMLGPEDRPGGPFRRAGGVLPFLQYLVLMLSAFTFACKDFGRAPSLVEGLRYDSLGISIVAVPKAMRSCPLCLVPWAAVPTSWNSGAVSVTTVIPTFHDIEGVAPLPEVGWAVHRWRKSRSPSLHTRARGTAGAARGARRAGPERSSSPYTSSLQVRAPHIPL